MSTGKRRLLTAGAVISTAGGVLVAALRGDYPLLAAALVVLGVMVLLIVDDLSYRYEETGPEGPRRRAHVVSFGGRAERAAAERPSDVSLDRTELRIYLAGYRAGLKSGDHDGAQLALSGSADWDGVAVYWQGYLDGVAHAAAERSAIAPPPRIAGIAS